MVNWDVLTEYKDVLLIVSSLIAPWIVIHTNVWNQNYVAGKTRDHWLTVLKKCNHINMGFEQIKTYKNDVYNRYSLFLDQIIILVIVVVFELTIIVNLTGYSPENISVIVYLSNIIIVFALFYRFDSNFTSKNLLKPQFSAELRIKKQSKKVFFKYYSLAGWIVGINVGIFLQVYNYILTSKLLLSNILSYAYFYMIGVVISIVFLLRVKEIISSIYLESITTIMNSKRHHFPFVTIKTQTEVVTGQLMDILDKDTITLNGDNRLKTVLWNKIELMEIKNGIM